MHRPVTESLRHARLFSKTITLAVLAAFLSLTFQPLALAAQLPSRPATAKATATATDPSAQLAQTLEATEAKLGELIEDFTAGRDAGPRLQDLKALHQQLKSLDQAALQSFAEVETHIKAKALPPVILDRHSDAVKSYTKDFQTLTNALTALEAAPDNPGRKPHAEAAFNHLKEKQKKRPHTPFDPATLPKQAVAVKTQQPRLRAEAFTDLQQSTQLAFNGNLSALSLTQTAALSAPTPADLVETPEIQFTPELQGIAALLYNDPVQLYEFVRNTFTYEPYYGSVKGSQATLTLQSGNDFDQASVLIALYRQAGIPARYVYGTVEIPIDKAMKWLGGITNPKVVGEALVSNGIPAKLIYIGGVPALVQLEHAWVEVYLPYENYRGVINDPNSKKSWVPLDPSFKLHDPNPNAVDLASAQNFDADSFFTNYLQTVKPRTPAEDYLKASIDYVSANLPGQRFYDLLSSGPLDEKVLGLLPNTLAYPIKALGSRLSAIPDNLRHRVNFELGQGNTIDFSPSLQYTATWTSLLHKRFTLSYEPATAQDAQTVAAYGNLYDTPPYLIHVKPLLKLEGQTVAEGGAVPMAADLTFRMTFTAANGQHQQTVTNILTTGATQAIALDSGYTSGRVITDRTAKWDAAVTAGEQGDSVIGEFLNLLAITYLQELGSSRKLTARTMKLLDTNHQAEVMVGVNLVVRYSFGVPRTVAIGGVEIDMDRNSSAVLSLDGDHSKTRRFNILGGMTSSALEHTVFEAVLSEPTLPVEAVSAVKALQVASSQGIPLHTIDAGNLQTKLAILQIDNAIKTDIQNAVNAGFTVTISERPIQLNDWRGVGYILLNPGTGEGYYRISGGLGGGSLTKVIAFLKESIIREDMAKRLIRLLRGLITFRSPTDAGEIISGWNPKRERIKGKVECHNGADIAVPIGTNVYAVAKGTVIAKQQSDGSGKYIGFGKYIEMDHGLGVFTLYGHLNSIVVTGDVEEGALIAKSGNTGLSEGPHVHFSILLTSEYYPKYKDGIYNCDASVDPQSFNWKP